MHSDRDQTEERLRDVLGRSDTVLLIGSGLSLWSGLPTWEKLLTSLAAHLRKQGRNVDNVTREIANGNLLLAASYATYNLSPRDLGAFLRTELSDATPSECHSLILTLGPTCIVTTNFDTIIEDALVKSGKSRPKVITNRHIAELADIIPASARNFVYKYHGDINDADSIVLDRSQYRRVQSENPAASRAFSTLLATRPVVMLGFGLRDPDFLNIQDDLVSTFQGQAGEYYAIVPDQNEEDVRFWRDQYRTELVTYSTICGSAGAEHVGFLELLKRLQPAHVEESGREASVGDPSPDSQASVTFMLARLGAATSRATEVNADMPLPVTISSDQPFGRGSLYRADVAHFFSVAPRVHIIIGSAGAGKTFAIKRKVNELAKALTDACLRDNAVPISPVPIYVPMASYTGDVEEILQSQLPIGLQLDDLLARQDVHIFFDAINEAPRVYIENGHLVSDIRNFCIRFGEVKITLSSRNESWLGAFEFDTYTVDDLSEDFVTKNVGIDWHEAIRNREILHVLRRPLLFSLAKKTDINPAAVSVPTDIYRQLFSHIGELVARDLGESFDVVSELSTVAHEMLASGVEVHSRDILAQMPVNGRIRNDWVDILSRHKIIIPLSENRFSFFHQSATEYLAATRMVALFNADEDSILGYLSDKRWDQAVFLLFGLLLPASQKSLFDTLMKVDIVAAARAAFYADFGSEQFVTLLLDRVVSDGSEMDFEDTWQLSHVLKTLPVPISCEGQLTQLSGAKDALGGWAIGKLCELFPDRQMELVSVALAHGDADDYNYVSKFVESSEFWGSGVSAHVLNLLAAFENKDAFHPFGDALGIIDGLSDEQLLELVKLNNAATHVIVEALREQNNLRSIALLFEMVRRSVTSAIFELYLVIRHPLGEDANSVILEPNEGVIETCLRDVEAAGERWGGHLLATLAKKGGGWRSSIDRKLEKFSEGTAKSVRFLISDGPIDKDIGDLVPFLEDLTDSHKEMVFGSDRWTSAGARDVEFALSIIPIECSEYLLSNLHFSEGGVELIRCSPISSWVEAILKIDRSDKSAYGIRRFLIEEGADTRAALTRYFLSADDDTFWQLIHIFSSPGTTVERCELPDVLYEKAATRIDEQRVANFIGENASERFIEGHVLNRSDVTSNPMIAMVLDIAGRRHNRRYAPGRLAQ